jgi:hypothetical protein
MAGMTIDKDAATISGIWFIAFVLWFIFWEVREIRKRLNGDD